MTWDYVCLHQALRSQILRDVLVGTYYVVYPADHLIVGPMRELDVIDVARQVSMCCVCVYLHPCVRVYACVFCVCTHACVCVIPMGSWGTTVSHNR